MTTLFRQSSLFGRSPAIGLVAVLAFAAGQPPVFAAKPNSRQQGQTAPAPEENVDLSTVANLANTSVQPAPESGSSQSKLRKTLGGKQFWAGEQVYFDWRIQRNSFTGHCRLLDGENRRHAAGSFERCHERLEQIKAERNLPPMQGPAVILLHGLFGNRTHMDNLAEYLREQGGYVVLSVGYPSTRGDVREHARSLARVLQRLDEIDEIYFVAHSLGNLVLRCYLEGTTDPVTGQQGDPRIRRIVMLGPPNHGAELANKLVPIDFSGKIAGPAAAELGENWKELSAHLATPTQPFGILAGGRGGERGMNPLLTGDNDLVVNVESTRLVGASDFRVLPVVHMTMMNDPKVQEYTLRFLQEGCFDSDATRQPIRAETIEQASSQVQQAAFTEPARSPSRQKQATKMPGRRQQAPVQR